MLNKRFRVTVVSVLVIASFSLFTLPLEARYDDTVRPDRASTPTMPAYQERGVTPAESYNHQPSKDPQKNGVTYLGKYTSRDAAKFIEGVKGKDVKVGGTYNDIDGFLTPYDSLLGGLATAVGVKAVTQSKLGWSAIGGLLQNAGSQLTNHVNNHGGGFKAYLVGNTVYIFTAK